MGNYSEKACEFIERAKRAMEQIEQIEIYLSQSSETEVDLMLTCKREKKDGETWYKDMEGESSRLNSMSSAPVAETMHIDRCSFKDEAAFGQLKESAEQLRKELAEKFSGVEVTGGLQFQPYCKKEAGTDSSPENKYENKYDMEEILRRMDEDFAPEMKEKILTGIYDATTEFQMMGLGTTVGFYEPDPDDTRYLYDTYKEHLQSISL